jgi:hypothetical protein
MIIIIDDAGVVAGALLGLAVAIIYRVYLRWSDRIAARRAPE